MINKEILRISLKKEVMKLHNKGISQFGISRKLNLPYWEAQQIIETELKKDVKEMYQ